MCLAALGCDEGQGYLYQRPADIVKFNAWLSAQGLLAPRALASNWA